MSTWQMLFNKISPSAQIICFMLILSRKASKRDGFVWRLGGMLALIGIYCVCFGTPTLVMPHTIMVSLVNMVLRICLLWLCLDISLWDSVFIFTVAYSCQYLTYSCSYVLQQAMGIFMQKSLLAYGVHFSVYLAACLLLWRFLSGMVVRYLEVNGNNRPLAFLSLIAIGIDTLLNFYMVSSVPEVSSNPLAFLCWRGATALCYVLLLCLMFNLLRIRHLHADRERLMQVLDEQKKHYEMSSAAIDQMNVYAHNLRHQFLLFTESSGKKAEDMVSTLAECVDYYDVQVETGCKALDVILTQENMVCRQKNIRFSCMADGNCLAFMEPVEIYTLFNNLLDNAIEAVESEPEAKRIISLSVRMQNGFSSIHIENYFHGAIRMENGFPVPDEYKKEGHGFGLSSIRMMAAKYDGVLSVDTKGDIFAVNILIPWKREDRETEG